MTIVLAENAADRQTTSLQTKWQALRSHLQAEKERIHQAICTYPTPIAGCDQQFNYLLEQRTQIQREWKRLLTAEKEGQRAANPHAVLDEFMRSSPFSYSN